MRRCWASSILVCVCVRERETEIVCERERDGDAIVKLLVYGTLRGAVGLQARLSY
jgi:hypothetical protein